MAATKAIQFLSLIAACCLTSRRDVGAAAADHATPRPPVVVAYVRFTPEVDAAYFAAFVDHYRHLGFDQVVAIRANQNLPEATERLKEQFGEFLDFVVPRKSDRKGRFPNNRAYTATAPQAILGRGFDWVFVLDSDEYLVLSQKYRSIQDYIASKQAEHGTLDAFSFRWALSHGLAPHCSDRPLRDLLGASVAVPYRNVKTMSKIESLILTDEFINHIPEEMKEGSRLFFEGRAIDFESASYKYRVSADSYRSDAIVLHLETRSLASLMSKALLPVVYHKGVKSKSALKTMIDPNHGAPGDYASFVHAVGIKARKPLDSGSGCMHPSMASKSKMFRCHAQPELHIDLDPFLPMPTTALPACDREMEQHTLEALLSKRNITTDDSSRIWETLLEVTLDLKKKATRCCHTLAAQVFPDGY